MPPKPALIKKPSLTKKPSISGKRKKKEQQQSALKKQKAVYTKWVNIKLEPGKLRLENLNEDLKSGVLLYNLLEELSQQKIEGKLSKGTYRVHHINNVTLCFRFMEKIGLSLVGIGSGDIVDGNDLVLGLIWRIMLFFFGAYFNLPKQSADLNTIKMKCMDWIRLKVVSFYLPDTETSLAFTITDVSSCLNDGKVFLALLCKFQQQYNQLMKDYKISCGGASGCGGASDDVEEWQFTGNAQVDFEKAVNGLQNKFGVVSLIDYEDEMPCSDERTTMLYLMLLMEKEPKITNFIPPIVSADNETIESVVSTDKTSTCLDPNQIDPVQSDESAQKEETNMSSSQEISPIKISSHIDIFKLTQSPVKHSSASHVLDMEGEEGDVMSDKLSPIAEKGKDRTASIDLIDWSDESTLVDDSLRSLTARFDDSQDLEPLYDPATKSPNKLDEKLDDSQDLEPLYDPATKSPNKLDEKLDDSQDLEPLYDPATKSPNKLDEKLDVSQELEPLYDPATNVEPVLAEEISIVGGKNDSGSDDDDDMSKSSMQFKANVKDESALLATLIHRKKSNSKLTSPLVEQRDTNKDIGSFDGEDNDEGGKSMNKSSMQFKANVKDESALLATLIHRKKSNSKLASPTAEPHLSTSSVKKQNVVLAEEEAVEKDEEKEGMIVQKQEQMSVAIQPDLSMDDLEDSSGNLEDDIKKFNRLKEHSMSNLEMIANSFMTESSDEEVEVQTVLSPPTTRVTSLGQDMYSDVSGQSDSDLIELYKQDSISMESLSIEKSDEHVAVTDASNNDNNQPGIFTDTTLPEKNEPTVVAELNDEVNQSIVAVPPSVEENEPTVVAELNDEVNPSIAAVPPSVEENEPTIVAELNDEGNPSIAAVPPSVEENEPTIVAELNDEVNPSIAAVPPSVEAKEPTIVAELNDEVNQSTAAVPPSVEANEPTIVAELNEQLPLNERATSLPQSPPRPSRDHDVFIETTLSQPTPLPPPPPPPPSSLVESNYAPLPSVTSAIRRADTNQVYEKEKEDETATDYSKNSASFNDVNSSSSKTLIQDSGVLHLHPSSTSLPNSNHQFQSPRSKSSTDSIKITTPRSVSKRTPSFSLSHKKTSRLNKSSGLKRMSESSLSHEISLTPLAAALLSVGKISLGHCPKLNWCGTVDMKHWNNIKFSADFSEVVKLDLGKCDIDMDFSYFPLSLKSSCDQLESLKLHANPKLKGDLHKLIPSSSSTSSVHIPLETVQSSLESKFSETLEKDYDTKTQEINGSDSKGTSVKSDKRGNSQLKVVWLYHTSISGDIAAFKRSPLLTQCFLDVLDANKTSNSRKSEVYNDDNEQSIGGIYGDISVFKSCVHLVKLSLKGCVGVFGDISFATDLCMLEELDLFDTHVKGNVSSLCKLVKLKRLSLGTDTKNNIIKNEEMFNSLMSFLKESPTKSNSSSQEFKSNSEETKHNNSGGRDDSSDLNKDMERKDVKNDQQISSVFTQFLYGDIQFICSMTNLIELRLNNTLVFGNIVSSVKLAQQRNRSGSSRISWLNLTNSPYLQCCCPSDMSWNSNGNREEQFSSSPFSSSGRVENDFRNELLELLPNGCSVFGV